MKIIHLLANNIKVWSSFLQKTEYHVNAYTDLGGLNKSLIQYNARDILGFILFPDNMDESVWKFLKRIDRMYQFRKMPVILISNNTDSEVVSTKKDFTSLEIYSIVAEDNSISDLDINNSILLLLALNDCVYPVLDRNRSNKQIESEVHLSGEARFLLGLLRKGEFDEFGT